MGISGGGRGRAHGAVAPEIIATLRARGFSRRSKRPVDPSGLRDVERAGSGTAAEDDRVAVRLTASAIQTGEFMGMPPTGKRYEIGEIHWFRIHDGQIAEHWHQADFLGMLRQLGAMPAGGGAMAGAGSGSDR